MRDYQSRKTTTFADVADDLQSALDDGDLFTRERVRELVKATGWMSFIFGLFCGACIAGALTWLLCVS